MISLVAFLAISFAAARSQFLFARDVHDSVEAKDGAYKDPQSGRIAIEGICSVDAENVSCWGVGGNRLSRLTETVTNVISTDPRSDLSLNFHKRSLLLVATDTLDNGLWSTADYKTSTYATELRGGIGDGGLRERRLTFTWLYQDKSVRSMTLYFQYHLKIPSTKLLESKVGSSLSLAGNVITLKSIAPTAIAFEIETQRGSITDPNRPTRKAWQYLFDCSHAVDALNLKVLVVPIDKFGRPIKQADGDGNPLPEGTTYLYSFSPMNQAIQFETPYGTPIQPVWTSVVDPNNTSGIELQGDIARQVVFRDVPLYPK